MAITHYYVRSYVNVSINCTNNIYKAIPINLTPLDSSSNSPISLTIAVEWVTKESKPNNLKPPKYLTSLENGTWRGLSY